jgi:serine/threonine protein kinase
VEQQRFGGYVLTARLGRGGMADVFRARREGAAGFERVVVVKKILSSHNEDPQFVQMFINEAKIAAQLTHPNIAQVFELGDHDGELFMVLEYVKGKDLLRLLKTLAKRRPDAPMMPPSCAAYVMREVCRGLGHAHEHCDDNGGARPIVHRDISPQNIMLSYDGVVKLVDFGIAKALDGARETTRTGSLKGKFAYMAPEQIGGRPASPSSDIFSAGVVLHEMLTGRRLFKGTTDYDTLQKVQTLTVPRPSTMSPDVSAELDAIVAQALTRDTSQRYARAALMARDLDEYLSAVRFSVDDMAEYMTEVFPPEAREEPLSEGQVSESYRVQQFEKVTGSTHASSPHARAQAGPRRRLAWYVGGGAALLLVVALVAYPLTRRHSTTPAPQPLAETPTVALEPAPPPNEAREAATVDVRLVSEPSGAEVYLGPKLLGAAPLTVHLLPAGHAQVTLTHGGYDDLSYTVQTGDAPSLTLRLSRKHSRHAIAAAASPSPSGKPRKVRVESVDEAKTPRMPHVDPIDD